MNWLPIANDLESITPNVGSTNGGTRTVLKLEGGTIPTSSYYTPTCRFGTILTSAIHASGAPLVVPAEYKMSPWESIRNRA